MNDINPWLWLLLPAFLIALVCFWRFHGLGRQILAARARESFRLQHERLEKLFLEKAESSGTPRGLRWVSCAFSHVTEFAKARKSRSIIALVGVTIQFEAIEGGDMEGLPNVPLPRQGTAVLEFVDAHWSASGKVLFNLDPRQALEQLHSELEPLVSKSPGH